MAAPDFRLTSPQPVKLKRPKPFKLTAREPLEQELHEAVVDMLTACLREPAYWVCYPAGLIQLSPPQMAKLMRSGLRRGIPDFLIIFEGLVFGLELKRHGGRLSKTRIGRTARGGLRVYEGQEEVFPKLQAAGMGIAVVHSVDEAMRQIRHWGLPFSGR
jgi:hypothetical protein